MSDEDEQFCDARSLWSLKTEQGGVAASRLTMYHSAEGLPQQKHIVQYNEWRNKTFRKFNDHKTPVDFVLAYIPGSNDIRRRIFEQNLRDEGLLLEKDENHKVHFVKINAPHEVLCRYAEIMKIKMPIKDEYENEDTNTEYKLCAEFSNDKDYLFDSNHEDFFPPSVRISVVAFILERKRFTSDQGAALDQGIDRLLALGAYKAAYPLHDGHHTEDGCERRRLLEDWAQVRHWLAHQPLHAIKDYFGVKHALYFTWLGFYTFMLIPASVVGIVCFVYGLATLSNNRLSNDICDDGLNITMCPQCDTHCDFWKLQDTCIQAKVTYLFDNNFTIFFAVFMSLWGTLYLELWKRYSADVTHRWGLTGFDLQAEHPRPQYLARLQNSKKTKRNEVTRVEEPAVPFWSVRLPCTLLSFSVVACLIIVACIAVFGVVLYRMSQLTSQYFVSSDEVLYKSLLMPCSAAMINLLLITALNLLYDHLAVRLTEMELLRTQTEFDDSLTLKIYLFQFVNYYSSIFYIAFLKGKFVGYPSKYNRIFGFRQEECSPGGCFLELFIQLAIIMVGKQALTSVLEILIPLCTKWFNTFVMKTGLHAPDGEDGVPICNQWTEDYKLIDYGPRGLFEEYLEMIIQYGFVTIFVSAFPLAPFFALLNNVFEMRLDAKKFLKYYRRPVPCRVRNIGVWFSIMHVLGRISVFTNAFMIAFASNFIPRLVYMMSVSASHTDEGFLQHSLAYFNTQDFQFPPKASTYGNITMCRYAEYRNPPTHDFPYKRPLIYWHILAARLAFIVAFQNIVSLVMMGVQWVIPDVPRKLGDQIKRESYRISEIVMEEERRRARGSAGCSTQGDQIISQDSNLRQRQHTVIDETTL